MSNDLSSWLYSQRSDFASGNDFSSTHANLLSKTLKKQPKIISIASGKGGVGKTTASLMIARALVAKQAKVLLIDCDYNLSNTAVKLGLPLSNNFYSLLSSEKTFSESVSKLGDLHLLTGCSGNTDIFSRDNIEHDKFIIDIIQAHGEEYDYVILDCPAGINRETVNLAAYADSRFMIVNPDSSSITDTYALIKILSKKYGLHENHLILNRVSNAKQFTRVVKSLMDTVSTFLDGRLKVLGSVKQLDIPTDQFDKTILRSEKNSLENNFVKIVEKYTDESTSLHHKMIAGVNSSFGHEVQARN